PSIHTFFSGPRERSRFLQVAKLFQGDSFCRPHSWCCGRVVKALHGGLVTCIFCKFATCCLFGFKPARGDIAPSRSGRIKKSIRTRRLEITMKVKTLFLSAGVVFMLQCHWLPKITITDFPAATITR